MATKAQRHHAATVMDEMYVHRAQLAYPPNDQRTGRDGYSWSLTEQEAMHLLAAGGTMQFDCSEYAPWVLKCAGCWPFSQPGWTGAHLTWWAAKRWPIYTDAKAAGVGALVIFGEGNGHHEGIVHTPDPHHGNPVLSSHGRPGLDRPTLQEEAASQAADGHPGVRFLSVAHL